MGKETGFQERSGISLKGPKGCSRIENTISKNKNFLDGFNIGKDTAEERIHATK